MLVYLLADYADPTVPGVFAFRASGLFLDGAVHARTPLLKARPDAPVLPRVPDLRFEPARTELRSTSDRPVDPFRVSRGQPRVAPRVVPDTPSEDH
jgi:hypothetical protein